jgi:hypothetical protein
MAYDRDDGYFHLTPDGWKRQDEEPFPENRIETWQYSMHQASGWSKENVSWSCVWASPDHSPSEREVLRRRFPIGR